MRDQEQDSDPKTVKDILTNFVKGNEVTVVDIAKKALPEGVNEVKFTVKNELQVPVRTESEPRNHTFFDADSLKKYLAVYKTEHTVVFVDAAAERVVIVLDETAKNQFETVMLIPKIHPLFAAWDDIICHSNQMGVKEFAAHLMKNRRSVSSPKGDEVAAMFSQIKLSKRITIDAGQGKHAVNGIVCESNIQGQPQQEVVDLPDYITVEAPLFLSTESREVTVDILLDSRGDNVFVALSSPDIIERKIEAFKEMTDGLTELPGVTVVQGCPEWVEWNYIRKVN